MKKHIVLMSVALVGLGMVGFTRPMESEKSWAERAKKKIEEAKDYVKKDVVGAETWRKLKPWKDYDEAIRKEDPSKVLLKAASSCDLDKCKRALKLGADVNYDAGEDGFTPLHHAVMNCDLPIATLLIENGAKVNKRSNRGYAPLHWAARNPKGLPMVKLLLEKGAEINIPDRKDRTPLEWAKGNYEISDFLVDKGAKWSSSFVESLKK